MRQFHVDIAKDYLVFCAAHFITYGGKCEGLHGHNYRVTAQLEGERDENGYLFDFVTLKHTLKDLCDRLDHRVLLPTQNKHLTIDVQQGEVSVCFKTKHYLFPESDVLLLPIANSTAESLAEFLCEQLKQAIPPDARARLTAMQVDVDECFGQVARYRETLA